jgi:hypothetical protein
MRCRNILKTLVITAVVVTMPITAAAQSGSTSTSSGKVGSWTAPRTPWGDPDIQGLWPANDMQGTPYERPESFGTRAT